MLNIVKAILYGIIEGITEWLPVSSTGHMILAEQLLKFDLSDEFLSMFRVVIQLGAIMAVVLLFWNKLWPFCKADPENPSPMTQKMKTGVGRAVMAHIRWPIMQLWFHILVASIPAAIIGLALDDWMDAHLYNYVVVAITLIVYGVAFLLVEKMPRKPSITRMSRITYKDAAVMGLWQVAALIPGTSRSGATILGGMLWGFSRPLAAQFTFYMAVPVMVGASFLKVVKFFLDGGVLTGMEIAVMLVGCLVAFVVSVVSIRFLMNYVKKHDLKVFGIYRIVLGIVVLAVFVVSMVQGGAAAA